jgi:hypothetical protein
MIRGSPSIGIKYGVEACDHWLGFFFYASLFTTIFMLLYGRKGWIVVLMQKDWKINYELNMWWFGV